jgi:hypothetical protein
MVCTSATAGRVLASNNCGGYFLADGKHTAFETYFERRDLLSTRARPMSSFSESPREAMDKPPNKR